MGKYIQSKNSACVNDYSLPPPPSIPDIFLHLCTYTLYQLLWNHIYCRGTEMTNIIMPYNLIVNILQVSINPMGVPCMGAHPDVTVKFMVSLASVLFTETSKSVCTEEYVVRHSLSSYLIIHFLLIKFYTILLVLLSPLIITFNRCNKLNAVCISYLLCFSKTCRWWWLC